MRSPQTEVEIYAIAQADRQLVALGPLAAAGRLRRLAPFAFVVGAVIVSLPLDREFGFEGGLLGGIGVLAMAAAAVVPWVRLPRWAQRVVVLVPIFLLAALISVEDRLASHLLVVMIVPLVWLALYESRRCLYVALAATTALLGAEVARRPPLDDSMRALMLTAVAVAILPAIRHLVTVNRAALLTLADLANLDSLTGLANRRGMTSRMNAFGDCGSDGLGMVFVDLDRFKLINDTYGHDAGDQLLVQVARRLSAASRATDVVARIGGDEFVVACHAGRAAGLALADRLRHAIADVPFQLGLETVVVTASVGFSHMSHQPDDVGLLIGEADHSMYLAKSSVG